MKTIKGISFEEWSKTAETKANYVVSREIDRCIWAFPCGTTVIANTYMPSNWFKKSIEQAIVGWNVPMTDENKRLAETYGGMMQEAPYAEEGIGEFVFESEKINEAMMNAWTFVAEQRENIIKDNKN